MHSTLILEEKLKAGEGLNLEYKTSFRFDQNRFKATGNKVQNDLVEKENINCMAALANTSGGTILIGVDNDGKIVGLEENLNLLENSKHGILSENVVAISEELS